MIVHVSAATWNVCKLPIGHLILAEIVAAAIIIKAFLVTLLFEYVQKVTHSRMTFRKLRMLTYVKNIY